MKKVERDKIKTLIALNGSQRLPYLEGEIFADASLIKFYIHALSGSHRWYRKSDSTLQLITAYADIVMNDRWEVAEPVILRSVQYSYIYAANIIKGRWPRAEAILATNPAYACYYAISVMVGRFEQAEATIATSPEHWTLYKDWFWR